MTAKNLDPQADKVVAAWHRYHPTARATHPQRARTAKKALAHQTVEELVLLIDFVHTADDKWAQWMRENDYLGLDYILRKEKLPDRVDKALRWQAEQKLAEDQWHASAYENEALIDGEEAKQKPKVKRYAPAPMDNTLDLGVMGRFKFRMNLSDGGE